MLLFLSYIVLTQLFYRNCNELNTDLYPTLLSGSTWNPWPQALFDTHMYVQHAVYSTFSSCPFAFSISHFHCHKQKSCFDLLIGHRPIFLMSPEQPLQLTGTCYEQISDLYPKDLHHLAFITWSSLPYPCTIYVSKVSDELCKNMYHLKTLYIVNGARVVVIRCTL